ncbi:MAG: cytochrome c-type biogenesis protein CcmH [Gallionella sp.]|nr:cytochrome c-type biogenesis protein CcmH [Gallionella sp.]
MRYFLIVLLCLLPTFSFAGVAKDIADDPVMERRMMHLAEKVRCLVCQSEPVSNSHSDWSNDVRQIMREKMKAGATDQEILDLLVERFGKSVLFDPPVDKETMPLWSAPFVLLLLGGAGLFYQLKKRRGQVVQTELSVEDEQRAATLLNDTVSAPPDSPTEPEKLDYDGTIRVRSLIAGAQPDGVREDVSDAHIKEPKA